MLINQHTLLFEPDADTVTKQVGIIDTECNIAKVISSAFDSASFLCEEYYSMAPDISLKVNKQQKLIIFPVVKNKAEQSFIKKPDTKCFFLNQRGFEKFSTSRFPFHN
jgi:hypothetical protein